MLKQSKAKQSKAKQSKAKQSTKKLFLTFFLFFFLPFASAQAALESQVESVTCGAISGWAWDSSNPSTRLKLKIVDTTGGGKTKLATITAQKKRTDLLNAGKGDGKYGFTYVLPASIRDGNPHKFAVRYKDTSADLTGSPQKTTTACYGKLNDTGITTCSDDSNNGLACPVTGFVGQDGDYGRDATKKLPKIGKGSAGFDFTKIGNDGSELNDSAVLGTGAKDWACTRDNVTGLIWEIKTADGGLRDQNNTYSWYNPDSTTNGGFAGYQNYGVCNGGISCDTDGYINAVNQLTLCGHNDWRLPKQSELLSIVDEGIAYPAPTIDSNYFPNTINTGFWSSSPFALDMTSWVSVVIFGGETGSSKFSGHGVRLVHTGQ